MATLNIALLAEHSVGKSSWIDAIAGNAIAPTSIQRETSEIDVYQIRYNVPYNNIYRLVDSLEKRHEMNKTKRKKNEHIIFDELKKPNIVNPAFKILGSKLNANIYDFPGLNDVSDKDNVYLKIFFENIKDIDLVIYMVDAKKPLTNTTELQQLHEIVKFMDDSKKKGIFFDLFIVINKYDDINDEDYFELYQNLLNILEKEFSNKFINSNKSKSSKKITDEKNPKDEISVFRFCSHKFFIHNLKKHVKKIKIPKFYSKELQNIFVTARVRVTHHIKKSLIKNEPINCDLIEIMEDISLLDELIEDNSFKPKIKEPEIGDWDNLIDVLENYYHQLPAKKSNDIYNYLDLKYNEMINEVNIDGVSKFVNELNRIKLLIDQKILTTNDMNILTKKYINNLFIDNKNIFVYCSHHKHDISIAEIVVPIILNINPSEIVYDEIINCLFHKNLTNSNNRKLIVVLLKQILMNKNIKTYYQAILELFDKFNIYDDTDTYLNVDISTCNASHINFTKKFPDDKFMSSNSYLINEILNNDIIRKNNSEFYDLILLTVSPIITLRLLKDAKIGWKDFEYVITNYLGTESMKYVYLIINSNNIPMDSIIGGSILSQKRFQEKYPVLYNYYIHYMNLVK